MKEKILKKTEKFILNSNQDINETKLEEIMYGLESIYLTITKIIIIIILSILFRSFKEVMIFILLYNLVRFTAFGAHAKSSASCLIISIVTFIAIPIFLKYIALNNIMKIIIGSISLIIISIYAPADTEKRPIISKKRRMTYKILSIIISIVYIVLSLYLQDSFINNTLIISLVLEAIMILPITYKLMGVTYNNYKNYKIDG